MEMRDIPKLIHISETKNMIMDAATRMFARKGYHAVTMNEIAEAVGIKVASIYNHYRSKQEIMDEILKRFEIGYIDYLKWQSKLNAKARTLEEVMDNLFNEEFIGLHDPVGHLGMAFIIREQHEFEKIRTLVFDLFHDYTIKYLQNDFSKLIEKGIIPPTDTETVARIFMYFVLTGNDLRVHELTGVAPPVNCVQMYAKLKEMLTLILKGGGADNT